MLLWMCVFEMCHSLSYKATGWHWRGHRLLRVVLSKIRGLGPKWSFATDTQRILNIRRRISPRWRFCSVAWPNLIKNFLDVQIIRNACFWQWRKFQVIHCTCSKVIDERYRQSVRLFVVSLFRYIPLLSTIVSLSEPEPDIFTAPAPASAPRKPVRRLRLRLRIPVLDTCQLWSRIFSKRRNWGCFEWYCGIFIWLEKPGGTGRDLPLRAPLIPLPGWDPGGTRVVLVESNLTRLWLKWVESESSRPWKWRIWVKSKSNHADRHLSQSWVNWILLESKLRHLLFFWETLKFCIYL